MRSGLGDWGKSMRLILPEGNGLVESPFARLPEVVSVPSVRARSFALFVVVTAVALLPRVSDLGTYLSPDEERWRANTYGFREGLQTGDLAKLYQQPHPGITTMWLAVSTVNTGSWSTRKLPLAVALAFFTGGAAVIAVRLWGPMIGLAVGLLVALNPQFVAHSRVLAMDALLAVFLLSAVLTLLWWLNGRRTGPLVLSGVFGALALLSKLAGGIIVAFVAGVFLSLLVRQRLTIRVAVRSTLVWILAFLVTLAVVFPTLLTNPGIVLEGTKQFFATEHYQGAVHALGPRWYPEALLLLTTPLHLLALVGLPALLVAPKRRRRDVGILGAFALLFFLGMQFSAKKGDRYLLPDFLLFDVLAVLLLATCAAAIGDRLPAIGRRTRTALLLFVGVLGLWQAAEIARLHPYVHAYRNPLFRSVALHRPMGWGEGLDLAAEYLNAKPNAERLLVASYYEGPFDYRFNGQVTSAERLAKETPEEIGADYVVLYRTMVGRAPDRWETKVLQQFAGVKPEKTIVLNGEVYVWIYRVIFPSARSTIETS